MSHHPIASRMGLQGAWRVAVLCSIAACGVHSDDRGRSTQVDLVIERPDSAVNPTSMTKYEAPAPSVAAISSIRVVVTDRSESTLAVAEAAVGPDRVMLLTLHVPTGPQRRFAVAAYDAERVLLFYGETTVDLAPEGTALITVRLRPVGLEIQPGSASIALGGTQALTATFAGTRVSRVTWAVNDVTGGNAEVGTITPGNPATYTAPLSSPGGGQVTIRATTTAPPASATATVFFIDPDGTDAVLDVDVSGNGAVVSSPEGIMCPSTCTERFPVGTTVTLTAQAEEGSRFDGWTGACEGMDACTVFMNDDTAVGARFTSEGVTLTVTATGKGSGYVISVPEGIACARRCEAVFPTGAVVSLTALPNEWSQFEGWSGGGCEGVAPCVLRLETDVTVSARYCRIDRDKPGGSCDD